MRLRVLFWLREDYFRFGIWMRLLVIEIRLYNARSLQSRHTVTADANRTQFPNYYLIISRLYSGQLKAAACDLFPSSVHGRRNALHNTALHFLRHPGRSVTQWLDQHLDHASVRPAAMTMQRHGHSSWSAADRMVSLCATLFICLHEVSGARRFHACVTDGTLPRRVEPSTGRVLNCVDRGLHGLPIKRFLYVVDGQSDTQAGGQSQNWSARSLWSIAVGDIYGGWRPNVQYTESASDGFLFACPVVYSEHSARVDIHSTVACTPVLL